jgi:regulatory protein
VTPQNKKLSTEEALGKIQRYCAYQERSHSEVRQKLFQYGLRESEVDDLLTQLITSGYLNEERYAKAFAGGKFRMKKWGRMKIVHALEAQSLSKNCINSGLKEIDPDDYLKTLRQILKKKNSELTEKNIYTLRDKLSKFAIQKGYEPDLVWKVLKEILPDR